MKITVKRFVILGAAGVERSGTPAESKDPRSRQYCRERGFLAEFGMTIREDGNQQPTTAFGGTGA